MIIQAILTLWIQVVLVPVALFAAMLGCALCYVAWRWE